MPYSVTFDEKGYVKTAMYSDVGYEIDDIKHYMCYHMTGGQLKLDEDRKEHLDLLHQAESVLAQSRYQLSLGNNDDLASYIRDLEAFVAEQRGILNG